MIFDVAMTVQLGITRSGVKVTVSDFLSLVQRRTGRGATPSRAGSVSGAASLCRVLPPWALCSASSATSVMLQIKYCTLVSSPSLPVHGGEKQNTALSSLRQHSQMNPFQQCPRRFEKQNQLFLSYAYSAYQRISIVLSRSDTDLLE